MLSFAEYFAYSVVTFGLLGAVFIGLEFFSVLADEIAERRTIFHVLNYIYLFIWLVVYPVGCVIAWIVSS